MKIAPPGRFAPRPPLALAAAGCAVVLLLASFASAAEAASGPDLVTASLGAPRGRALSGEELETRTTQVASLVRCPVCQGSSIADSPSTMAQNMKAEVRELLARGYDQEQIISYFEAAYGEFIRLEPKRDGMKGLVWVLPALLLVGGGAVVFASARRLSRRAARTEVVEDAAALDAYALPADPELARYVLRVRELAYGWPGGAPPTQSNQRSN